MPAKMELISQIYLRIDGVNAPQDMMDNLIYIEVDDSLNLADMFTIYLHDPNLRWSDSDALAIGKSVEISTPGDSERAGYLLPPGGIRLSDRPQGGA